MPPMRACSCRPGRSRHDSRSPLRFLEQQLGALSKAGLVESFRGGGGGCRLARSPAEVTVAEIADAIEGQIFPMFCLEPSDHVLPGLTVWAARLLG